MQTLPEIVKGRALNGIHIPDMTSKLIERTKSKAIYFRWDGVYEVMRIIIAREMIKTFHGNLKKYPERELYPSNEDFGKYAWSFRDEKLARELYERLPNKVVRRY